MKRFLRVPIIILVLVASACSTAPKAPSTQSLLTDDYSLLTEYLDKYIPSEMKKYKLTGLSVALVDDQRVVWSSGFGFADKSTETPATNTTRYGAGSVSKLFTALSVMKLAENNMIDLDAPIKDSVPEFDLKTRFGSVDDITLRNVLSHHAGIPGNIVDGMWTNDADSYKSVTTRLNQYYAAYPPNTVFAYSNAGYTVAGHAVENASGIPFVRYVDETLLKSLDMNDSNMAFDSSGENVAKSYIVGKEVQTLGLRDLPAGGLITNVEDLSNLVKLINGDGYYKSQLFKPETLDAMLDVQVVDSVYEPSGFNAIGWFHFTRFLNNKYTVVGHTGQTMAHSASLVVAPDLKLGVAILSNSPSNGGLESITDNILNLAHTIKTRKTLSSIKAPDRIVKPWPGEEASFDGRYTSLFGYLDIKQNADNYELYVDGTKMTLRKNDDSGYTLKAKWLGFIPVKVSGISDLSLFAREVSGEKLLFSQRANGQRMLVATQVSTQERDSVWDKRLGEYRLTNPIETEVDLLDIERVELSYSDGFYQLSMEGGVGNQRAPLTLINDSQATLQGYGRGLGETLLIQPDDSILHAGLIFEKVLK